MNTDEISLAGRTTPIELGADEFAEIGHALVDQIADLLSGMGDRRLGPDTDPAEMRKVLGADAGLPEAGTDAAGLMRETADMLIDNSLYNGHPRFFGYITGAPAPIGILGDLLASAVNPNLGGWFLSPMASEIESQAVRWIAELIGFPKDGDGVLVSGGNVANMLGFWAARAAKAPWDIRAAGMHSAERRTLRVYASAGTHTWIQKAADLSGMGVDSIRWIEQGAEDCIDVGKLRAAIEADRASGDDPFMVVGTAGSVSTGAVDDLPALRERCDEFNLWLHADGAYGAFAAAADNVPPELKAIALADSVALDPHKWLYAPLEAGCVLVRDRDALLAAFSYRPEYYRFQEEEGVNFFERGFQNSRGFRALKVWLQLKQVGRAGYQQMIEEDIELARAFHGLAVEHTHLEAFTQGLSITTYRYVPTDLAERSREPAVLEYLNALNQGIQDAMGKGGQAFVSNALIGEIYALRMCVVNFRTALEDVVALAEISVELGQGLDRSMRPDALRDG